MRLGLSLLFCGLISFGFTQTYPYQEAISTLCSPPFAGRGYVNQGSEKAATFIAQEFQKIGLQPLKRNNYLQNFSFPVQSFQGRVSSF